MGLVGEEKQEMKIVDYAVTYPVTFTSSGKQTLVTIGELYNIEGKLLQRDSVATDIMVLSH